MKDHPKSMATFIEDSKARLPELRKMIEDIVDAVHPLELLCQLSVQMMHAENKFPDKEEIAKSQVRAEFVAWLILSKPFVAPPGEVFVGGQVLTPLEKALDDYFVAYSTSLMTLPAEDEFEESKLRLKSMLQTDAVHVRGEGLPSQVTALAKGMYGPHEVWMRENLGFSIEDAFEFTKATFDLVADKFNERKQEGQQVQQDVLADLKEILSKPESELTDNERNAVEWCSQEGPENVASQLGCKHLFSELRNALGFSAQELAEKLDQEQPSSALIAFLDRMSQTIGSVKTEPDLVGFNPLAERPLVREEDVFFLPVPPVLFDALLTTFHFDLWGDAAYRATYDAERASWLEQQALAAFERQLPGAEVHWSLGYGPKKNRQELDGLVLYDNKLILIECKWKTLTLSARQGNEEAAAVDIEKSIGASYEQARRARDYIKNATGPVIFLASDGTEVTIDPNSISEIYLVSLLGRGAMASLAANLPMLTPPGMFAEDEYPWALSLTDLETVFAFLQFPSQLFDYIKRRDAFVRDRRSMAHDEWDLLGVYLDGKLDPDDPDFASAMSFVLSGFDVQVDEYLRSKDYPELTKPDIPRRNIPVRLETFMRAIEKSDQPGRSDLIVALLSLPDAALAQIEEYFSELETRCQQDSKFHSVSMFFKQKQVGVVLAGTNGDADDLNRRLFPFVVAKKYLSPGSTWLGIGIDFALPDPPHVVSFATGEWVYDETLERFIEETGLRLNPE